MQWTPWVTVVCGHQPCGEKVKRAWPPNHPAPKYCGPLCAKRAGRSRNKRKTAERRASGEVIGQVLVVDVRCERPGCKRTGKREWHTNSTDKPRYCSLGCARRAQATSYEERRLAVAESLCEHPEKLAYMPTPAGTRRAARDAVRFEKYAYACKCLRLHLTSNVIQGVPLLCTAPHLPFNDRWAAWHTYLLPIAQRLQERRWRQASAG